MSGHAALDFAHDCLLAERGVEIAEKREEIRMIGLQLRALFIDSGDLLSCLARPVVSDIAENVHSRDAQSAALTD